MNNTIFDQQRTAILGIDPGNTGAWALVDKEFGELLAYGRLPLRQHGRRKVVSAVDLAWALEHDGCTRAFVEDVHAMPGQGVSSMFTFGRGLGVVEGVLATLGIEARYLRPKAWQAATLEGLPRGAQVKQSAVTRAIELWPSLAKTLEVKAAWGIADAALIAEAGRRLLLASADTP